MYSYLFRLFRQQLPVFLLLAVLSGLSGAARAQYITTVAGTPNAMGNSGDGGQSLVSKLSYPNDVALDAAGNVYIADYSAHVVRKVDGSTGIISTFAGNGSYGYAGDGGQAINATLAGVFGVTVDAGGNVYITDADYCVIRKVSPSGMITTVAGDVDQGGSYSGDGASALAAGLAYPSNVALDAAGNLYIADTYNNAVRKVDVTTGNISTVAGRGSNSAASYTGPATGANLSYINYITLDAAGSLYLTDGGTVRKMDASGNLTTVAGTNGTTSPFNYTGPAASAGIFGNGVKVDRSGNIYISDGSTSTIRKVDAAGNMTNYAGNGVRGYGGDNGLANSNIAALSNPYGMDLDAAGNLFVAEYSNYIIRKIGTLPPPQTITFSDITVYFGVADFTLGGSASSGLPLTYTVADPSIAKISGNSIHLLKPGTTTITALQPGSFFWGAASATVNLVVLQPNQVITFTDIQIPEGSPDFALTATASSGLPVSYTIADPGIATITNGVVHLLQSGATTITASQGGDGSTWTPAAPVTVKLIVTQQIDFSDITKNYGDADFTVTATASDGQPVAFSLADPTLASFINGNTLHILKAGVTTIDVSHIGSTAPPVSKTLTINKAPLIITANDQTRQQGQDNPPLTVSYSGFVYDETNATLSEQPTVTTTAITSSPMGTYPIAAGSAVADNYTITYKTGTLTIGPAAGEAVMENKLDATFAGGMLQAQVSSLTTQHAVLQVVDMSGHVLLTQNVSLTGGFVNTFQLPVFNITHGVYIVSIRGSGLKLSDKVIY